MTLVARSVLSLFLLYALTLVAMAEPIGWIERFALADDRAAVMDELIPGTDDHFFYHCLHYQNSGQLAQAEAMLDRWQKSKAGAITPAIRSMTDRQRLLTYEQTPQRTVEYLIQRLDVNLRHAGPRDRENDPFPSVIDGAQLEITKLLELAFSRGDRYTAAATTELARRILEDQPRPNFVSLETLLDAIEAPTVDRLDELVIRELQERSKGSRRFGDRSAHRFLTLRQLQSVAAEIPEVSHQQNMVNAILGRLGPSTEINLAVDDNARLRYLQRVEAYTRDLPVSYNSLKAAAAFRLLSENLTHGIYDRELLLRYLNLPRVSPLVPVEWLQRSRSTAARLDEDFSNVAILPPIGDEQPIVRAHLEHFLVSAASTDAFEGLLKPAYLNQVLAETKLMAGIGPADRWYAMLSGDGPALRNRVELELASDNPRTLALDKPARIDVDIKNVDELTVRIYEINSLAFFRDNEQPLDTDIDLDGLVPTHQRTLSFDQPPIRRHRETIGLPEIDGRGVWIVDLIGKSVRTRAILRRGALDYVQRTSADGVTFTVIDQDRKPVGNAKMLVGSREFLAGDDGRIIVPPADAALTRNGILTDGTLAIEVLFLQPGEAYELAAGMHIDPVLIQSGGATELLIRPRLSMSGTPVDPSMLEEVTVTIESTDLDGIVTKMDIDDLKLSQGSELVVPIRVPSRLVRLTANLAGKIRRLADSQTKTVSVSHHWDIAGIRRTSHPLDAFLTRDEDDYVIEVRGRNGELVPGATVNVDLSTRMTTEPITFVLASDNAGQIRLGELEHVTQISFALLDGQRRSQSVHSINGFDSDWPETIYTTVGRPVRLAWPVSEVDATDRYRLVGVAENRVRTDHQDKLNRADGFLVIKDLEAGDYRLVDRLTAKSHLIAVVDGPVVDQVAVGVSRHHSLSPALPLSIASVDQNAQGLRIQLSGSTDGARVHVYAKRYLGGSDAIHALGLPALSLSSRQTMPSRCGYVSGLRLGDEYRYVMRRRAAAKYPGVMLPQPGLILNPWETEQTTNESQSVRADQPVPASDASGGRGMPSDTSDAANQAFQANGSDYDFLADPGVVVANLVPDADGVVTIPAEVVGGMPIIDIVACDAVNLVRQTIASELVPVETIDQRLAKSLDPAVPVSMQRAVLIAGPNQPLDLAAIGDARIQVYGSVASLFRLYQTLVSDDRLNEFEQLSRWHTLTPDQKQSAYSRLASHELHLFVWAHDRDFFDEVIGPYLANKKEKQFIDHWLLGDDLSKFTDLWKYQTLNAAERALLAIRIPEVAETINRELREMVDQRDADHDATRRMIETALKSESMSMSMGFDGEEMGGAFGGAGMGGGIMGGMGGAADPFGDGDADPFAAGESLDDLFGEAAPREPNSRARAARGSSASRTKAAVGYFEQRTSMGRQAAFFRELDATRQWAESQWDRVRTAGRQDPASLISINSFWSDLAESQWTGNNGSNPDVSTGLLEATDSRHAALVALALSGLPMESGKIDLPKDRTIPYQPEHAVAVVTKRLKDLDRGDATGDILVGQQFLIHEPSDASEFREANEFVVGTVYQGQVVISNPSSRPQTLDVLWQLPAGSIPLGGGQMTDSQVVTLGPFAVQAIQYTFYFPASGEFTHYPATVADGDDLVAQAPVRTFVVRDEAAAPDPTDWKWIAASGSAQQIADFLQTANLRKLDWEQVAHRMRQADVYRVVIDTLAKHHLTNDTLWAYALIHQNPDDLAQYVSFQEDLIETIGAAIRSPLLTVDPIERDQYEMLEYAPLVRARIHRLGEQDEILNPTFYTHYQEFLGMLAHQNDIDATDRLELAYYLLIQNRISEAIEQFDRVDSKQITISLQYDYLRAYLAMHQGRYDTANQIATVHQDHPIPRWRTRFSELKSQLSGHSTTQMVADSGKTPDRLGIDPNAGDLAILDRQRIQSEAAGVLPEVIASIEGDRIRIDHRQTESANVRLYGVDLELLFSKAPFVRDDLKRMAMVRPVQNQALVFDSKNGTAYADLNENLRRQTWLVEVVSGASRSTTLAYGGNMTTYVAEAMGQLQSTDATTKKPISTAYVKVYAKYPSGEVKFYKDGYTDVRGWFDYASLSAGDAKGAIRYAILVLSDEHGATLHDVAVPNQ